MSLVTLGVLKNVKFRLSQSSTKFDAVARIHETIPMVKMFHHPRSRKILDFPLKLHFYHFSEKLNFLGFYNAKDTFCISKVL